MLLELQPCCSNEERSINGVGRISLSYGNPSLEHAYNNGCRPV